MHDYSMDDEFIYCAFIKTMPSGKKPKKGTGKKGTGKKTVKRNPSGQKTVKRKPSGKKPVKRKPSAYNLFMKEELEKLKKSHPKLDHKERFKLAAAGWTKAKK